MNTAPLVRKIEKGVYASPDGAWEINLVDDEYWCEEPHGNCPGNEEHCGQYWLVFRRIGGPDSIDYEPQEGFDLLRDAKQYLATRLAEEEA